MVKKKRTNIINIILKLVLVLLFVYVIYKQTFIDNDAGLMWKEVKSNLYNSNIFLLALTFLLMFLNWSLEALKWKLLIASFEKISFAKAIKTIMLGITTGFITPAKLGDYFGRVLLIENKNNWKGVWATFISSISQSVATVFFGYFGLLYFFRYFFKVENYLFYSFAFLGALLIVLAILVYYHAEIALNIARRVGLKKIVGKIINADNNIKELIPSGTLNKVLILSISRYIIYTIQYLLLIRFFGIEGETIDLITAILTIFIIQSGIPLPPVSNILARGEIAIFIFSYFSTNKILILSSTFSLWIINILIPAFIGLIIIFRINIPKSFGYD